MNVLNKIGVTMILVAGITFAGENVSGEFSTDVTFADEVSFSTPYSGISISGDGWAVSSTYNDNSFSIEEAMYMVSLTDAVSLTLGTQAVPYGIAWGLHRPSANAFASVPRMGYTANGVSAATSMYGASVNAFYGNDGYWAARGSYSLLDQTVGVSSTSDENYLLDAAGSVNVLGFGVNWSGEYDLTDGATQGDYWGRGSVATGYVAGLSALGGYSSTAGEGELIYGLSYQHNDNTRVSSELSTDGDITVRLSYSF